MKVELIDNNGKAIEGGLELNEKVWGLSYNEDLVAQVLFVYNMNQRKATAHAKTRGDVSGGGKKPWRQKGTGRARAGSTRSPIWVKGGVTFVPNDRNWKKSINEKMRKKALAVVLSSKLASSDIYFVKLSDKAEMKDFRSSLLKLTDGKKFLMVSENDKVLKSLRNTEKGLIAKAQDLNVYEALNNRKIVVDAEAINVIETRLSNGK